MSGAGVDTKSGGGTTQYYDYNRHKLMFDSEDESSCLKNWEDQIACVDIPLLVDMSHWVGCITRFTYNLVHPCRKVRFELPSVTKELKAN